MSCSRTQHGGGRSRTPDLSLRSPTLYHWATALPAKTRTSAGLVTIILPLLVVSTKDCFFFHHIQHPDIFLWIWATSWQNLLLPYANNKGADQPTHLRSLISAFVVRCLDSIIPLVSLAEIWSLYLASLAAQSGLCLTLSQTPKTGYRSHISQSITKPKIHMHPREDSD